MFLSLMLLMAMQQPGEALALDTTTANYDFTIWGKGFCEHSITFGASTKKIADVFPEECGVPTPQVGTTGELHTLPYVTEANFPHGGRWGVGADIHPPEPVDVPSVDVTDGQSPLAPCVSKGPGAFTVWNSCPQPRPSCADKTRILVHDEQNPPKFWCHKVGGAQ